MSNKPSNEFGPSTVAVIKGLIESAHIVSPTADLARRIYDAVDGNVQATRASRDIGDPALGMFMGMNVAVGILYAHAAELAMKCVLQQSGTEYGDLRKSHNLGDLFQALPVSIKEYAEKQYRDSANWQGKDLATTLEEAGNAIMTLRYVTESRGLGTPVIWFGALESVALSALSTIQSNGAVRVPDTGNVTKQAA